MFHWRKTSEEKPFYNKFGSSNEVLGINELRQREIYVYTRGSWYWEGMPDFKVDPPIYWHYLPERPSQKEIDNEFNNTTK